MRRENAPHLSRLAPPSGTFERITSMKTCGIEAVDENGKVVHYFRRQAQAYRAGYVRSSITKCLSGKNKTHRGLTWRYARGSPVERSSSALVGFEAIQVGWWIK